MHWHTDMLDCLLALRRGTGVKAISLTGPHRIIATGGTDESALPGRGPMMEKHSSDR